MAEGLAGVDHGEVDVVRHARRPQEGAAGADHPRHGVGEAHRAVVQPRGEVHTEEEGLQRAPLRRPRFQVLIFYYQKCIR